MLKTVREVLDQKVGIGSVGNPDWYEDFEEALDKRKYGRAEVIADANNASFGKEALSYATGLLDEVEAHIESLRIDDEGHEDFKEPKIKFEGGTEIYDFDLDAYYAFEYLDTAFGILEILEGRAKPGLISRTAGLFENSEEKYEKNYLDLSSVKLRKTKSRALSLGSELFELYDDPTEEDHPVEKFRLVEENLDREY